MSLNGFALYKKTVCNYHTHTLGSSAEVSTRFNPLYISLLVFILGFSSANPVVLDVAEVRSPPIAPAANSSEILVRQDGIPPGECDYHLNEVLEYSECACNSVMKTWCWTSDYGPKGSTKSYEAACDQSQMCMPSMVSAYTAACVESDRFGTMDISASWDATCADFNFLSYGAIQVVTRVVGGCPPQNWPNYAEYTDSNTGQNFGSVNVGSFRWLSPVFQATGNSVHVCVDYPSGPPITLAVAFTPQINDRCDWCWRVVFCFTGSILS